MITRNRKRTREDGYTQQFFETPISNCHLFPDSQQNTFFLPQNIWICVFDLLNDSDLSSTIILVSNEFLEICRKADAFLWKKRCLNLWEDKVESSWKPFLDDEDLCFRQKYIQSIRESQRSQLHPSELCSFTWGFRFKRAAGEWWATMDPYWNSNHSRQIMTSHFLPNGTIIHSEVNDCSGILKKMVFINCVGGSQEHVGQLEETREASS
mmetsp:Transcript_11132/g.17076  ORF Transcript_11132/g.17076 Transcript_11132/m.17076 type:complete len:210 (+) Transcript_11132:59-688(+)